MSDLRKTYLTINDIAIRWRVHRATVARILARFGCGGIKFGTAKQAGRRYLATDVERVEHLAGLGSPSCGPKSTTTNSDRRGANLL